VDVEASRSLAMRWTAGNGDGSIVTIREQGTAASPPVDFTDYAADSDIATAPETAPGSGNFVVYKSNGKLAKITGLTTGTTYIVTVYAWARFGAETDYLVPGAPEVTELLDGPPMHNYDNAAECSNCHINHGNAGFVPKDANAEAVCTECHQDTGPAEGKVDFALHLTPKYGNVNPDCGDCHEVHKPVAPETTESTRPAELGGATAFNQSFIRANVSNYVATATTDDAIYHVAGDDLAIEGGDATTSRGICQACHTQTDYHKNNSALEPSQCHQGGINDTCDDPPAQIDCLGCHTHKGNFAPSGGSCTGCHVNAQDADTQVPGSRRAILGEFSLLSHHVTGTVNEADCEVCHAHNYDDGTTIHTHKDGFITLWNVDDHNATPIQLSKYANPFTDTAEAAKLTQFCLNCHDTDGAAAEAAPSAPFTGSGAPPKIKDNPDHWTPSSHNTGGDGTTKRPRQPKELHVGAIR
jgi:hypothetical protein